jgi:hypothetical protein
MNHTVAVLAEDDTTVKSSQRELAGEHSVWCVRRILLIIRYFPNKV